MKRMCVCAFSQDEPLFAEVQSTHAKTASIECSRPSKIYSRAPEPLDGVSTTSDEPRADKSALGTLARGITPRSCVTGQGGLVRRRAQ